MRLALAAVALALGSRIACGESPPSADDPQVRARAQTIWRERCATCHGLDGDGDGPQGRYLEVKPRRLSDRAWQATVDDQRLRTVIVEGGPAVGLHVGMAPNPDLRDQPAVVEALVRHIRRL
ncbi:MAG: c-type cytochrome [Myxococcales bacterium]|nr:c-type cytochrome [Myxococcales bacterium]